MDKLFIKLVKTCKNFYYKEYIIEKSRKLKMSLRFFNIFYFKFIKLAIKLKFIKKILLKKFTYKLFP